MAELNQALSWISFRPVIYDEIEHFQTGVDYPFSKRKSSIEPSMATLQTGRSHLHKVFLQKNVVCEDKNIFSEFLFWADEACNSDDTSNFDFTKYKLVKSHLEPTLSLERVYF